MGGVIGTGGAGISADAAGGAINIGGTTAVGDVTGSTNGIYATTNGGGAIAINVANAVSGGTGFGIQTTAAEGASITVNDGGSVTGGAGAIMAAGGGADTLILNTGSSISGAAMLNAGNDVLNAAGGAYTNVFGGADTDSVNFSGAGRTLNNNGAAGDALQEFEVFNFTSGGFELLGVHTGLTQANFLADSNTLSGSLEAATATISSGATLNASDGVTLTGALINEGVLNIGNSPGAFTINGDFEQSASGVLPIEIDGAANDLLIVTGDVTLAGTLDVIVLDGLALGVSSRTIIDGGTGLIGVFDTVTGSSGLLIGQSVEYDLTNFDVNLTTTISSASSISGLSANQMNVGDSFINLLAEPTLDPAVVNFIGAIGALQTQEELAAALEDLHPEGLDIGLKFLTTSQSNFLSLIMGQSLGSGGVEPVQLASLAGGPVSVSGSNNGANVWAAFQAIGLAQSGIVQNIGFDGRAFDFMAGVSGIGQGPVTFGVAGGYSDYSGDGDGPLGDEVDSNVYRMAFSLRAEINGGMRTGVNGHVDSVLSYANGESDFVMKLNNPVTTTPISQSGSADISSIDWQTRLTLDGMEGRNWPLKPHLQMGVSRHKQSAANIGSTGATALVVDELKHTRASIGVGAAYEHQWRKTMGFRAAVTGVHYFGDTENVFSLRFASAPVGTATFQTFGKAVKRQVQLDADFVYTHDSGFTLSIGAFGEIGDLNIYGGKLSISKRF